MAPNVQRRSSYLKHIGSPWWHFCRPPGSRAGNNALIVYCSVECTVCCIWFVVSGSTQARQITRPLVFLPHNSQCFQKTVQTKKELKNFFSPILLRNPEKVKNAKLPTPILSKWKLVINLSSSKMKPQVFSLKSFDFAQKFCRPKISSHIIDLLLQLLLQYPNYVLAQQCKWFEYNVVPKLII